MRLFAKMVLLVSLAGAVLIVGAVNSLQNMNDPAVVDSEALMQGKRVVVLGRPTYVQAAGAVHVPNIEDLPGRLTDWDAGSGQVDYDFFRRAYAGSCPGELYDNSPRNLRDVSLTLKQHLSADIGQDCTRGGGK